MILTMPMSFSEINFEITCVCFGGEIQQAGSCQSSHCQFHSHSAPSPLGFSQSRCSGQAFLLQLFMASCILRAGTIITAL